MLRLRDRGHEAIDEVTHRVDGSCLLALHLCLEVQVVPEVLGVVIEGVNDVVAVAGILFED